MVFTKRILRMDLETTFMEQFTGSATANLAFGLLFLLFIGLKKLCDRKSKCKSRCHTACLDIDVRDITVREPIELGERPTEV